MPLKRPAILTSLLIAAFTVLSPVAWGQDATRCGGTLCDLYYGAAGPTTPQPPAPQRPTSQQPVAATEGQPNLVDRFFSGKPAPAGPLVDVQGGGIINAIKGAPAERCGGTICDLMYGGPSPAELRAAQGVSESPAVAVAPSAQAAAGDLAPRPPPPARTVAVERAPKPRCTNATDPWKCYR